MTCKDCLFYYDKDMCIIEEEMSCDGFPYTEQAETLCIDFKKKYQKYGRLIDADRLYDIIEQKYKFSSGDIHRTYSEVLDIICDAETIIESED